MSFLYCDGCGWTQDDFWSDKPKGYNPGNYLREILNDVFDDDLDSPMEMEDNRKEYIHESLEMFKLTGETKFRITTKRELLVEELENWIDKIKRQKYITKEQYEKENPNHICPMCGETLIED